MIKPSLYKSITGTQIQDGSKCFQSLSEMNNYFEEEKQQFEKWNKLDKTVKLKKLVVYSEKFSTENNLTEQEKEQLCAMFIVWLDQGKLTRVKDVEYNKESGEIISIPSIIHNKIQNRFTLKIIEKRAQTMKRTLA